MANLIIDIGNTALKAAWADGVTLGKTFRYQGERIMDFILSLTSRMKPDTMVIATARELSHHNRNVLSGECRNIVIMDSRHTEVLSGYGLPAYLAPDRAASIVASRYLFGGKSCTIFDFGTTLTIDFLDTEGGYSGGNISPGCRTRFKSIDRYSKSLPLVDTPDTIEEAGTSIVSSIGAGIIRGMMFEIEGYVASRPENIVVFTGGDAIYFAKQMKNSIFVVCNLVLIGLALIADEYNRKNN
ncbi:MAG: type III pantothenate kinase [Bacteroidales bacterium]|nr:type III pantothenate kinase [Bacteroides sp.]MCM1198267.1 type III pantothenate kinase [Clostridium sp.]MCM1502897.1 type III pantothenate kinase [Bacteroidales bacterium]